MRRMRRQVTLGLFLSLLCGAASAQTQVTPPFGLDVTPKSAEVLAEERRDPVAGTCARAADVLAAQVRAIVGDVSIRRDPARGTVWTGKLLIEREPPLVPPMECTKTEFRIFEATFDPKTPPAKFPWPYPPRP